MLGREIALATLLREPVTEPCITYCWMTRAAYMTRITGRDYWSDREGVFYEYLRRAGANFVPQWYMPGEEHRLLEETGRAHDFGPGGTDHATGLEDVLRAIDSLPDDAAVEASFDAESTARNYAATLDARMARADNEVLFIDAFGQPDFMGGYTRWGYDNYLLALVEHPEAMRRWFHHTALCGRLWNQAIALASERHGIAPFVYSGQDICGANGPMVSPAVLRDLFFPELAWCLEPLHDADVRVIWHCDGDIRPILPDLIDVGVDGLQGFEEEHGPCYEDIAGLTNRRGLPVALWGCVSVVTTLPFGTTNDVRKAVERSFTVAGPGRGFVLSSTSSVLSETPDDNIDALFEHGRKFGREFLGG